jgi:hypothetical protein
LSHGLGQGPVKHKVHRYAPIETRKRAIVALLLGAPGLGVFLWGVVGLFAVPGNPIVFLMMLVGGLLSVVSAQLARGILGEAEAAPRDANPVLASHRRAEDEAVETDDPVAVLQNRFARGEMSEEEFDRRMERLLESDREREVGEADRELERH